MTNDEYRKIEAFISLEISKKYPGMFLSTDETAEALNTSRQRLAESNNFGLKPIKTLGRTYKYLRPLVVKAIMNQIYESQK